MRIVIGDLWRSKADVIAVTTNGYVGKKGLVMGRGAALEATKHHDDIQMFAGSHVTAIGEQIEPRLYLYGFNVVPATKPALGLFQVKYMWNDPANLALIAFSALSMRMWMLRHFKATIACNYPGIGNGGLKREQVEPILRDTLGSQDRITFHIKKT